MTIKQVDAQNVLRKASFVPYKHLIFPLKQLCMSTKPLPLLSFLLLFGALSLSAQSTADINTLLDQWHEAAAKADEDFYFGAMADDAFFIGTDATEVWDKATFVQLYLPLFQERQSAWDFKPLRRNVVLSDDETYAWFNETLDTWMGLCRGSGVLQKQEGRWRIKQYVLSVAVDNDAIRQVIEIHQKLEKQ